MLRTRETAVVGIVLCLVLVILGLTTFGQEGAAPRVAASPALRAVYRQIDSQFETVKPIFQHSCYDCHSDQTAFPWYHKLPLIKSMIDSDIKEGRENLDLSRGFPFPGTTDQIALLTRIRREISEGDMPPFGYRLMHWGRLIEGTRQDSVFLWIDSSIEALTRLQAGN